LVILSNAAAVGTFLLGHRRVNRLGYGAMQLAGPNVFGPPRDKATAIAVLRDAVRRGINHIDTSDFYGPHITNELIREALHPYPNDLVIVTKFGATRGPEGSVLPAMGHEQLMRAVHDNLRNLRLDVLDVVNLRSMLRNDVPAEGSLEEPLTAMADLQRQGLIRHIGLSNVTAAQVMQGRGIGDIVCVQKSLQSCESARCEPGAMAGATGDRLRRVLSARWHIARAIRDARQRCPPPSGDPHAGCACMATATRAKHSPHSRDRFSASSP
jgi:aryl-alcohol dehydrogenase-like predicted oxidoreductase